MSGVSVGAERGALYQNFGGKPDPFCGSGYVVRFSGFGTGPSCPSPSPGVLMLWNVVTFARLARCPFSEHGARRKCPKLPGLSQPLHRTRHTAGKPGRIWRWGGIAVSVFASSDQLITALLLNISVVEQPIAVFMGSVALPPLGRLSKLDYSVTRTVPTPSSTFSDSCRRYLSNAALLNTDVFLLGSNRALKVGPGGGVTTPMIATPPSRQLLRMPRTSACASVSDRHEAEV